jgi:hypothetical protein
MAIYLRFRRSLEERFIRKIHKVDYLICVLEDAKGCFIPWLSRKDMGDDSFSKIRTLYPLVWAEPGG